jgi:hypothetical protein
LTALHPTHPTEGLALLTAPDPTESVPPLAALNPAVSVALLCDPPDLTEAVLNPTESMAMAAPDLTAWALNVGRLSVDPTEDDYKIYPNYHVGEVDWSRVTVTSCPTSNIPTNPRTNDSETLAGLASNSSNGPSQDQGRHLNSCQIVNHVLSAGPLSKESCPTSNIPTNRRSNDSETLAGLASNSSNGPSQDQGRHLNPTVNHVLAAGPLAKGESCPGLSTPLAGSAEERQLNPLATLGHAASDPALTGSQSLTSPGCAAYSSCLPVLSSSTTYPMGSNASVTQLSLAHPWLHPPHRRALHVSLVVIQELRVRS